MLHALGASRVALLSNNPDKARQLRSCGVTVVAQVRTGVHVVRRERPLPGDEGAPGRAHARPPAAGVTDASRSEPNASRKRFRKALIGQTGAVESGRIPSTQPQPAIRPITAGSWAMIEIGTS